jgi:hypothetical protein
MLMSFPLSVHVKEIPLAAWIVLVLIVIFILILNVSLLSALRRRNSADSHVLQRFMNGIRNPNQKENEMLGDLRTRVERLSEPDQKE